jgi:hypothetical protein
VTGKPTSFVAHTQFGGLLVGTLSVEGDTITFLNDMLVGGLPCQFYG